MATRGFAAHTVFFDGEADQFGEQCFGEKADLRMVCSDHRPGAIGTLDDEVAVYLLKRRFSSQFFQDREGVIDTFLFTAECAFGHSMRDGHPTAGFAKQVSEFLRRQARGKNGQ